MVFKVIRDKFAPPKEVSAESVKEKYDLVKLHDRVGRMADSYLFEKLSLPLDRFSDECLTALRETAPTKVTVTADAVLISHVYVEKKMTPLNLFLQTASEAMAQKALRDYGRAIKQLAAANIFPGDLLLKNFGVTRVNRVVFYDYDEIELVTDCNFRHIPEARTPEQEMASQPWYYVGPRDVFPEEFPGFLMRAGPNLDVPAPAARRDLRRGLLERRQATPAGGRDHGRLPLPYGVPVPAVTRVMISASGLN